MRATGSNRFPDLNTDESTFSGGDNSSRSPARACIPLRILVLVSATILLCSCGPSAKEKAEIERAVATKKETAQIEAEIALAQTKNDLDA